MFSAILFICKFKCLAPLLFAFSLLSIPVVVPASEPPKVEDRYDVHHPTAGLPRSSTPLRAYHSDRNHPLNRLHQLLFLAEVVPAEVSGALPTELTAGTDANKPWYFRKRQGLEADRKLFGGDVRVSPVIGTSAAFADELHDLSQKIRSEGTIPDLTSLQRLMLQWDVLSVWWRLEQKDDISQVVLYELAQLIRDLAVDEQELRSLPSGWDEARQSLSDPSSGPQHQPQAAAYFSADDILSLESGWREISRKSTQLFVATQSLRSSRVFLKMDEEKELADWIHQQSESKEREDGRPDSQIETAMVLSLMGITPELKPVATPVIDEIRFRSVFGRDTTIDLEQTTTRDGSSLWIYFIDRQETFTQQKPAFRQIPEETQSIFLEYGTAKYATYAAQCTLCHRLTNAGDQTVAGIRSLSQNAAPRIEPDASYRGRLAEAQMKFVVDRLAERLEAGATDLLKIKLKFRDVSAVEPESR